MWGQPLPQPARPEPRAGDSEPHSVQSVAGRTCPADYRYGAAVLARPAELRVESAWIAGGLYGNVFALQALLEAFEAEAGSKALVFNGDFHWFDVAARDFAAIDRAVMRHHGLRGNVETELARPHADAGCGCGYPDWVDDVTVTRSNRILERLRETAQRVEGSRAMLAALPVHLRMDVGRARIGVVHGDAESLAGWAFSQEALGKAEGERAAQESFGEADVDIFASSHTCLPVLQRFARDCIVANNGAAGMPNFAGELFGLVTRIAVTPSDAAVYECRMGDVFIEAVPLRYDVQAWQRRFLEQWPRGSDAYASYYERITAGPRFTRAQALRITKA